jgi:prepilin signal peptidase PulO-like enzyme (type II secretory pathway)
VNALLAIPIEARLAALAVVGVCLGSLLNAAVYALAYNRREIGPWCMARADRRAIDWIPVVGWLAMRRQASRHGNWFWLRPLLVELLFGAVLALLYWHEVHRRGLWLADWPAWRNVFQQIPAPIKLPMRIEWITHVTFALHAVLLFAMFIASLIDMDEKTIPDAVTVPTTLFALLVIGAFPWALLPGGFIELVAARPFGMGDRLLPFLTLASPYPWPDMLVGGGNFVSLAIGLGCFWLWALALAYRPWRTRRGLKFAFYLLARRVGQSMARPTAWAPAVVGTILIALCWHFGGPRWIGLLSALVGMATGGSLIWIVRLIGRAVMGREAMGFGDVTLMAMIGAVVGWQACLIIFFLAPIFALALGVVQFVMRREAELFFGPFLCMAAVVVVARWTGVWTWAGQAFQLGLAIPVIMIVAFGLMAVLLAAIQVMKRLFGGR